MEGSGNTELVKPILNSFDQLAFVILTTQAGLAGNLCIFGLATVWAQHFLLH